MTGPIAHTDTSLLPVPGTGVQPLHTVCIPPTFTETAERLNSSRRLDRKWREIGELSDEAGGYTTFVACLSHAGTIQYGIEITI
jgi:hypothetical protein